MGAYGPTCDAHGGRGRRVSPTAGPWPAGDSRAEESQGPRGQAVYSRSARPLRTGPAATVLITAQTIDSRRGRADRDAQRAGRWGGDSAQSAPPSPGRNHSTTTTPCRAPAARRARGAKRERAQSRMQRRRGRAVSARLVPWRRKFEPHGLWIFGIRSQTSRCGRLGICPVGLSLGSSDA
jgi:hypothetical protein